MKKEKDNLEILLKYLKGELSEDEEKALKVRLESEKELAEELNLLETLRFVVRNPDKVRGYSGIQELSARQFKEFRKRNESTEGPYGITISDSGLNPMPQGVRRVYDTISKDTRRVRFRIDGLELILSFYPISSENFRIQGQILGIKDLAPVKVIITSGELKFDDICDECYLFEFKRVPALNYTLRIIYKNKTIGMADFEL